MSCSGHFATKACMVTRAKVLLICGMRYGALVGLRVRLLRHPSSSDRAIQIGHAGDAGLIVAASSRSFTKRPCSLRNSVNGLADAFWFITCDDHAKERGGNPGGAECRHV